MASIMREESTKYMDFGMRDASPSVILRPPMSLSRLNPPSDAVAVTSRRHVLYSSYSMITIRYPDCAPNPSLIVSDLVDIPLPKSKIETPLRQHASIEALKHYVPRRMALPSP